MLELLDLFQFYQEVPVEADPVEFDPLDGNPHASVSKILTSVRQR